LLEVAVGNYQKIPRWKNGCAFAFVNKWFINLTQPTHAADAAKADAKNYDAST
jgi:hypothetical protein